MCTCEVKASEREEVLDVVMSQFHHNQADQSPATNNTERHAGSSKSEAKAPNYVADKTKRGELYL